MVNFHSESMICSFSILEREFLFTCERVFEPVHVKRALNTQVNSKYREVEDASDKEPHLWPSERLCMYI